MMKFAFALVAVLVLASPLLAYNVPRTGNGALADEVQDFVNLVPIDEIVSVALRYIATDSEVQALVKFVHSDESTQLVIVIEGMPEIKNIMNYTQKNGLDIYKMVNRLNKYLNIAQLTPPSNLRMVRSSGGIRGMLDEIKALVPKEKVVEMHRNKMATSKVWADFVAQLKAPEFQNVANKLCNDATFNTILHKAKDAQVDVEVVIGIVERSLGLKITCRP